MKRYTNHGWTRSVVVLSLACALGSACESEESSSEDAAANSADSSDTETPSEDATGEQPSTPAGDPPLPSCVAAASVELVETILLTEFLPEGTLPESVWDCTEPGEPDAPPALHWSWSEAGLQYDYYYEEVAWMRLGAGLSLYVTELPPLASPWFEARLEVASGDADSDLSAALNSDTYAFLNCETVGMEVAGGGSLRVETSDDGHKTVVLDEVREVASSLLTAEDLEAMTEVFACSETSTLPPSTPCASLMIDGCVGYETANQGVARLQCFQSDGAFVMDIEEAELAAMTTCAEEQVSGWLESGLEPCALEVGIDELLLGPQAYLLDLDSMPDTACLNLSRTTASWDSDAATYEYRRRQFGPGNTSGTEWALAISPADTAYLNVDAYPYLACNSFNASISCGLSIDITSSAPTRVVKVNNFTTCEPPLQDEAGPYEEQLLSHASKTCAE